MLWSEKVPYLNKLMISMLWSGYSEKTRELLATRILARYSQNIRNFTELSRPLYRSRSMRQEVVKVDKSTWFREQGATAVLMLPTTRGSELAKRVRRMLESTTGPRGTSIKVVEKPGTAIMQSIAPNNPFQMQSCG